MAKAMPVGTIRTWENGSYIKAHDGNMFSSGWIALATSPELEEIGRICDRLANAMIYQKLPINGEKFLDHEIEEFKGGKYTPEDFKQYQGFEGASRYSFRNEFSKRFMKPKIDIAEAISEALLNANSKIALDTGTSLKDDHLSADVKKEIRERVRIEYKEKPNYFTTNEAGELQSIVERTKDQLDKGFEFEGTQKEVYDSAVKIADSMSTSYERIGVKKKQKIATIAEINKAFPDNWGVQNAFETYIDGEYSNYMRKYRDRIIEDEVKDQEATFGVKLDDSIDKFYSGLYKKLESGSAEQYPFQELMDIRFAAKYGKELKGKWTYDMVPAIEKIEKMVTSMPKGHFLDNNSIMAVTQEDYNGGSHGGYAWYSSRERRINLSSDAVGTSIWARLQSTDDEFESTMAHEIGHAVSEKFGRDDTTSYKQFAVACGWSYSQHELRSGQTATGDAKNIPREGTNAHIALLTEYAHKSQEEAFAEYYSIYHNNKKAIDHWLDTGDVSGLKKRSQTVSEHHDSTHTVGDILGFKKMDTAKYQEVDRVIRNKRLTSSEHIKLELISPWSQQLILKNTLITVLQK